MINRTTSDHVGFHLWLSGSPAAIKRTVRAHSGGLVSTYASKNILGQNIKESNFAKVGQIKIKNLNEINN